MEQFQLWMAGALATQPNRDKTYLLLCVENAPTEALTSLPPEGMLCRIVGAMQPSAAAAAAPPAPDSSEKRITRLLTAIGIPSNLLGFSYLRSALMMVAAQPDSSLQLTTRLYPDIAAQYSVAPRSVERAIRHAIALAWERGSGEGYQRVLGRLGSVVGDRPTNSEFLAQTAECIRLGVFS